VFIENIGLIDSIRTPGGNNTGVFWLGSDMAVKRFELMQELVPRAREFWVPYFKGSPLVKSQIDALRQACLASGSHVTEIPATSAQELEVALQKLVQDGARPDAILNLSEPLVTFSDAFAVMAKFADNHKIPIGGIPATAPVYESLFGLLPTNIPQGRQAAFLVDKVLKGAPAGSIPAVLAESQLQINRRVAAKLGIKVSENLISRADEVIR
jgi:putative tryptophan/tyrosine transport system substrate-binding protein